VAPAASGGLCMVGVRAVQYPCACVPVCLYISCSAATHSTHTPRAPPQASDSLFQDGALVAWYHGGLDRDSAQQLLQSGARGESLQPVSLMGF
jgi:hypothetical protein